MSDKEKILEEAERLLKNFKITSLSFGPMIKPGTKDVVEAVKVGVKEMLKDLPNYLEIEGKKYDVYQTCERVTLCDETELSIPTDKPEGQRLQSWYRVGTPTADGSILTAAVHENDCGVASPLENKKKIRPLKSGVAISADKKTIGTLGCFAIDNEDGKLVALTNAHVVNGGVIPLLTSKQEGIGRNYSILGKKVYQGDFTKDGGTDFETSYSKITDEDVIGIVKRYFPVGMKYTFQGKYSKQNVYEDQFQIDAALIAVKKGTVDAESWKLVGVDNADFNSGGVPTFCGELEFYEWLRDSYWSGYSQDVGGGVDQFNTPNEPDMIISGAATGAKDGTKTGDDDYRWRISGPLKFQEMEIDGGGKLVSMNARNNVALVRQQNKDRYRPNADDTSFIDVVPRGDWNCADNILPGDSGSVVYSKINGSWKAVCLVYATKSSIGGSPEDPVTIYTEGLVIPFYIVAKLMNISEWDGTVNDSIFSENSESGFRVDTRHVKGLSSIYKHRVGGKSYFQAGLVPRESRPYPPMKEAFQTGEEVKPIPQSSLIEQFVKYDSITVETPAGGSWNDNETSYYSDPIWFKITNLNISESNIPAVIKGSGLDYGVLSLDLAIVHNDQIDNLEDFYFSEEVKKTAMYGSTPILEIFGNSVKTTISGGLAHILPKLKSLLDGGQSDADNGLRSPNLYRLRFKNGARTGKLQSASSINITNTTCYKEYVPWEFGSDKKLKGAAKAEPAALEDWVSRGASILLVLSYVGKDLNYVVDQVTVTTLKNK